MMSKAEQDIDYEFVKRFELAVRKEMSSDPCYSSTCTALIGQDTLLNNNTQALERSL
jgi:hypothetical protein